MVLKYMYTHVIYVHNNLSLPLAMWQSYVSQHDIYILDEWAKTSFISMYFSFSNNTWPCTSSGLWLIISHLATMFKSTRSSRVFFSETKESHYLWLILCKWFESVKLFWTITITICTHYLWLILSGSKVFTHYI